jgi:hypothetical protein
VNAAEKDIWALLEQDAPAGCDAVQALYSWNLNYDAGRGPFGLFCDLIGYSEDAYGETIWQGKPSDSLGYVELDKLAKALTEYAHRPADVLNYVSALLEAEAQS